MKAKLLHDISASSAQVIINQLSGVAVFYILSNYFSKHDFGEINWALAVLLTIFAVMGGGIDQVVVRKTASGEDASPLLQTYIFHTLFTGIPFALLAGFAAMFAAATYPRLSILAMLAVGQLFIFLSLPFKQVANGKELFRVLLTMSTGANIIRVAGLIGLAYTGGITITAFLIIYIAASATELLICIYQFKKHVHPCIKFSVNWPAYHSLIKESIPQLGVIVCNAGIARFDWILLGLLSTTPILAEYSFAYKAFEVSTLPLLIAAPLLLPRITKWFSQNDGGFPEQKKQFLFVLARLEILFAAYTLLALNIVWAPVVDAITGNKYGAVNSKTILILSCCIPFLYVNNILWSVNFAQQRLRMVFGVFAVTFFINLAGNLLLIPFFNAKGAAIAYLVAIVIQTFHFLALTKIQHIQRVLVYLALALTCALVSGLLAKALSSQVAIQLTIATIIYVIVAGIGRQFKAGDWHLAKSMALK